MNPTFHLFLFFFFYLYDVRVIQHWVLGAEVPLGLYTFIQNFNSSSFLLKKSKLASGPA